MSTHPNISASKFISECDAADFKAKQKRGATPLIFPTVHRNGTSGKDLLEQILDARAALHDAVQALQNACPNARDYYVQGNGAIQTALEQHTNRLAALDGVYRELEQIAEAIVDQQ